MFLDAVLLALTPFLPCESFPDLRICEGLPSFEIVKEQRGLAERHYKFWEEEEKRRNGWWGGHSMDAWERFETWDILMEACDPKMDPIVRRQALGKLVEKIGWWALLTGNIPSPVPSE